ncbi:MAG: hypothetical protein ACKV2T_02565 [Kofleriaceae bacterium]
MSFKSLFPQLQTAWDVINGKAEPLKTTQYGAFNTPASSNRSHLDATARMSNDGDLEGLSFGMGAWDGPGLTNNSSLRLVDAGLDLGRYKERDGTDAYGFNLDAGLWEHQGEQVEVGVASANARAKVSSKGAELGLQGDGPQAAYINKESGSASDEMTRFGVSPIGPGAGVRAHWGDEDGDDLRELGFGVDLGDFTYDFTTEDPLRSLARLGTGGVVGGKREGALLGGDRERNWTADAVGAAMDLFGHFAD